MRVTSAAFERSILASRASGEAALMSLSGDQADFCPHCRSPFEIVHVKFRLNGTAMIATCPNCAIAHVDERRADNVKKLAITTRGFWHGVARMDPLDRRFKYVLAFLIGAVIHRSCTAPHRSCLWRDLPRRNSRGCANGHSRRCARNNLLAKKAPALSAWQRRVAGRRSNAYSGPATGENNDRRNAIRWRCGLIRQRKRPPEGGLLNGD
jgi:hypothetical protein